MLMSKASADQRIRREQPRVVQIVPETHDEHVRVRHGVVEIGAEVGGEVTHLGDGFGLHH